MKDAYSFDLDEARRGNPTTSMFVAYLQHLCAAWA